MMINNVRKNVMVVSPFPADSLDPVYSTTMSRLWMPTFSIVR